MKKIGILEIIVILAIIITSASIAYKFYSGSESKYEFSGDQMYKCAWICEKILNKKFPLNATIIGRWTATKKPFKGEVEIYNARGGTLYAIYNNTPITIGGEMAYEEDIAASKILLKPVGKSMIVYNVKPIEGRTLNNVYVNLTNDITHSLGLEKYKNLKILDVEVSGDVGVDSTTFSPVQRQMILNKFDAEIKKGMNIYFVEKGFIISGTTNLNTLKNLNNYVNSSEVLTSKLKVYIVLNNTLNQIPKEIKDNYAIITLN
ncbi:conserved hypothetical protein [Methanocaldococcus vulcanius M7]|uniref:Transcription regulator TrmB C-terminal domain-containing protein n=1 Tax=Methanocaldococcus vulcanius (strain ATCC 700851 / DSM 12094 / M7) TaxID=579137 RepID=C9RGK5_METVM|nr:TrmB family transcriptional regulator sugar-binding domain-containing protein [Methanocaldococcus vulcanius]ACX72707.1 conserved hypothetical protein [Methanocaldococcus vulcanius M7]